MLMVYLTNMDYIDLMKIVGLSLASLLSGAGILTLLVKVSSKWLGQRMLDHYNNQHAKELEKIKANYSSALAKTQHEFEKIERKHFLYSQSQFELYNSLWKQLIYTRRLADDLWSEADPHKIPSFAEQISQTKHVIEENMLLIEESHYDALLKLMNEFENFNVGKIKLIEVRQSTVENVLDNIEDISKMIADNGDAKQRYDSLVTQVGNYFRNQIHG